MEIITDIPLWLYLKCRTNFSKNNKMVQAGLFGVKGRDYQKIILKQKALLEKFQIRIGKYVSYLENANGLLRSSSRNVTLGPHIEKISFRNAES